MRKALAFRLEDRAQIQVHVLAVVLRSDEQHRPLSHLHAEPVAVGAHGYGKLLGERGLADPALASHERQVLVGDDVLDDPFSFRLWVSGEEGRFDDATFEVAFLPVDVVFVEGGGDGVRHRLWSETASAIIVHGPGSAMSEEAKRTAPEPKRRRMSLTADRRAARPASCVDRSVAVF
jgi:hypothetical protein